MKHFLVIVALITTGVLFGQAQYGTGTKTVISYPGSGGSANVSDAIYDADAWNGNTDAPSKNAVRDKFESLSTGGGGGTNMMVSTINSATTLAPTFDIPGLSTTAASCRRVTFRLTLAHDVTTVSAPAGTLIDGDTMVWEIKQAAGGPHTIASNAWNAKYKFNTGTVTGITLSTAENALDQIVFSYRAAEDVWLVSGYNFGFQL